MKDMRIVIPVALSILVSCAKESTATYLCELSVEYAGSGKISLSGDGETVWNKNDALSVFYGNEINTLWHYKGGDKSTSGRIEGPGASILEGKVTALYPYSGTAALNGNIISTELPKEQPFRSGSYSPSSVVMYASSGTNHLYFEYATAIIALNFSVLHTCTINSVEFSSMDGKDVSGTMEISLDDGKISVNGFDRILMPYGKSISGGDTETFLFCVPPGEYESGIQFTVHIDGSADKTVRYTSPLSMRRGDLIHIDDYYCRTYAVELDFSHNSPFDQKLPTTDVLGTRDYSLTHPELGTLNFSISNTTGGFRYYSNMLRVNDGADAGDACIKLPGVSGLTLSEISVLISNQSGRAFKVGSAPGLSDICDSQTVPSGVRTTLSANYSAGDCYLSVTAKNTQIIKLGLLYY